MDERVQREKKALVGKMQKGLRMLVVLERLGWTLADVDVKQEPLGLCVGTGDLLAPSVPVPSPHTGFF